VTIKDPWNIQVPSNIGYWIKMVNGVVHVYASEEGMNQNEFIDYPYPSLTQFLDDMQLICNMITDGPLKSYCFHRLSYLSSKFQLHVILNDKRELSAQKAVPHRDFYNIRKVDTHVHAASCMNQKHLLRFIKKTLKNHPNDLVCLNEHGQPMTLEKVFESMNVTSYDLSVDMLDVHAVS